MSATSGDPIAGDGGEGEATGNSEGGTTAALQKKRLRRVSFAENTSVHFFDRDEEENETTPPEELASRVGVDDDIEGKIDLLGFRQFEDSRGEDEGDREDGEGVSDDEMRRSFLRPVESPSSGSAFGSATSNDVAEDNFFGPVSTSFIKPDRLSDSGASDVNHDVTMDSTAFSMHFRSLAMSDSGVDLKTPTGSFLSFEEKTPTQTNAGSSMELTVPKNLICQSSSPAMSKSGSSSSSDMSLVGGSPARYDYERLSPRLDALLAEDSKNLNAISEYSIHAGPKSPRNLGSKSFAQTENENGLIKIAKNRKVASKMSGDANGDFPASPIAHATSDFLSFTSNKLGLDVLVDKTKFSPNQSSKERACQSLLDDKFGQADIYIQNETPLADLISASPAKRRELLLCSASPFKRMSVLTPQEQRGLQCNETIKHDSASSIQKSISKLKLIEASPFSYSLAAENQNIRPYDLSKSSPLDIILEREMNNIKMKHLDASFRGTESQFLSDYCGNGAQVSTSSMETNHTEDLLSSGHMPKTLVSNAAAVSPSQLISSGKKMKHELFWSKDPNDNMLVTAGIDSLSAEVTLDYTGEKKLTGLPPSPDKWLQKKLTALPDLQNELSTESLLHDRFVKLQKLSPGRNLTSQGSATGKNISTVHLDRVRSSSVGRSVHSSSPALEVGCFNLVQVNSTLDRDVNHDDGDEANKMIEGSQFIHTMKRDENLQSGIGLTRSTIEVPRGEPDAASSGSSVPSIRSNLKELGLQKNLLDSFTQSPSRKVFRIACKDNVGLHDVESVMADSSNQIKSPSLKRKNEIFDLKDREYRDKVAADQRSPKLLKVGYHGMETLGCTNENCGERSVVVHSLKNWTDIYLRFSDDAERLFATSMDKLNISVIDLLEDFLFQWKKSKTYEMLGNNIIAQKKPVLCDFHLERVGETRLLLLQIMHGKAKLHLMRAKQKRLLRKLQQLSSGIQESRMLNLNFLPKLKMNVPSDVLGLQNFARMMQQDELMSKVACDKVTPMKQTLEALDKKKANFSKALQTSCKIKGEPSCADIVLLVNDHLTKRSHCRFIRQNMQMWVVDDVRRWNGHPDIVLNYLDLVSQRIRLTVDSPTSIVISNKLDDTNIVMNFPNLDPCKAFGAVLIAESTWKHLGSRSLAQETQVTSSLLGNLVDVIQELQMAQIELRNLTETTFHCPFVGQLDLHLSFISYKKGEKVSLMLDMSCLNWGIYPSEVVPSELTAFNGMNNTSEDLIIGQIRDAVKSLRAGYMRILRLLRCISLVVQGSSK